MDENNSNRQSDERRYPAELRSDTVVVCRDGIDRIGPLFGDSLAWSREVLIAAARKLGEGGVSRRMAETIIRAFNERRLLTPLPDVEVSAICAGVVRKNRGAMRAVQTALSALCLGPEWRGSTHSLSFVWLLTGDACSWSVVSENELTRESVRVIGSASTLASSIHPDATAKMLIHALRDMVPGATNAERPDSPFEQEDASTRLSKALLFAKVWTIVDDPDRGPQRVTTTCADMPDIYSSDGVGLTWDENTGRATLFVRVATAVTTVLRDHPEFGRGRKTTTQLAHLLRSASGFITDRARSSRFRDNGRWWGIDVTDLLVSEPGAIAADQGALCAFNGTHGTDGTPENTALWSVPVVPQNDAANLASSNVRSMRKGGVK